MNIAAKLTAQIRAKEVSSPLGPILIVCHDDALSGVYFRDQRDCPADADLSSSILCDKAANWLIHYFDGKQPSIDFALDLSRGTELQQAVWSALLEIPFGTTRSYAQIANSIGRRPAVRAVANAIGKNPLSILVPCHRVIGSNGSLTGYAGGLSRKAWLLEHESINCQANTRFPNFLVRT